jgi:hypothetical protein
VEPPDDVAQLLAVPVDLDVVELAARAARQLGQALADRVRAVSQLAQARRRHAVRRARQLVPNEVPQDRPLVDVAAEARLDGLSQPLIAFLEVHARSPLRKAATKRS